MLGGYKRQSNRAHQSRKPYCVWLPLFTACLLFVSFLDVPLHAQASASISQGFQTNDTNLTPGALVSLVPQDQGRVQLANVDRTNQLVGVIGSQPLIALSTSSSQVQVVTSGVTLTLVSDINGSIVTGDKITASPIDGVGMKATKSTEVVGTAQDDFTNIRSTQLTMTDRQGKTQTIHAGLLPVQINVTYFAVPDTAPMTFLPSFLQQIANTIAGHTVSAVRVLIGLFVLLLGFISSGILLYSSVQSSIISIGRNPLSETAIHKSLLQVGITASGILLVMVITIYLVLTT